MKKFLEIFKGDREHTLYKKYEEEYQNYTEGAGSRVISIYP